MPLRETRELEPFDPTYRDTIGLPPAGSGGNTTTPTGGSVFPSSGSFPFPDWAKSIDSSALNWRTLEDGNLLNKRTNKVYAPSGSFISSLSDYLAGERDDSGMNPDGPPSSGTVGQKWTDPDSGEVWQYYQNLGWMKNTADPKNPNTIPGADELDQGGYTGNPNPSDGPIPNQGSGGFPPIQMSPNWDPASGNWIGLPPPTGSSGGGGQGPANPMPGMPTTGVARNSPYIGLSRASGTPVSQREAFKPWGSPLGYLSQALRYGGTPEQYLMGGYEGMDAATAAAQAAALRG